LEKKHKRKKSIALVQFGGGEFKKGVLFFTPRTEKEPELVKVKGGGFRTTDEQTSAI